MARCCISCRENHFNCFGCFILLQGKDGFLGRCVISPMVRLEGHQTPEPRLQWHKIRRGEEEGGELLAACELFLVSLSCFMFYFYSWHIHYYSLFVAFNLYPAAEWVASNTSLLCIFVFCPLLISCSNVKWYNKGNDCLIHVLYLQDEGAELPFTPPMRGELYAVRSGVRPKLQRSAIEVCFISLLFFCLSFHFFVIANESRYKKIICSWLPFL